MVVFRYFYLILLGLGRRIISSYFVLISGFFILIVSRPFTISGLCTVCGTVLVTLERSGAYFSVPSGHLHTSKLARNESTFGSILGVYIHHLGLCLHFHLIPYLMYGGGVPVALVGTTLKNLYLSRLASAYSAGDVDLAPKRPQNPHRFPLGAWLRNFQGSKCCRLEPSPPTGHGHDA